MLRQFDNPANPAIHERTTAQEIWRDTGGHLDAFVAGIGTGGTITGVGRFLRRKGSAAKVIGVEPAAAAVLTGGPVGNHILAGIGAGFVPSVLDRTVVDDVIAVEEAEAIEAARRAAQADGVCAGISSGAALAAVLRRSTQAELTGRRVGVLFPDGGERYIGTELVDALPERARTPEDPRRRQVGLG
jgi:cysteine synthase A